MKKPRDSGDQSLRDSGTFLFMGEVETEAIAPCVKWILRENVRKRHKRLTLVISSHGGYIADCFALIDIMENSSIPVDTLGIGCIASCGLTIFLHGRRRVLAKNAYVLSHQYSETEGAGKKYHEIVAERRSQDWMHERHIEIYAEKTGLSQAKVIRHLMGPSDSHLTARDALKLGICHEISGEK